MALSRAAYVVGVGMTKFVKPGKVENFDYPDMGREAGKKALADAGITYDQVEQVVTGFVYGDSCCGQRAAYELGISGVPVYNVNNNCSTGSTALMLARQFVGGGVNDCVLALGFEKMETGSLDKMKKFPDRLDPLKCYVDTLKEMWEYTDAPYLAQIFGSAGKEHMERYGTTREHFAKVAYKNHLHSVNNPYAQFQKAFTMEQILESPTLVDPITKLQCCPTSDGSAACVVASEDFVKKHNLESQAVKILGQAMGTDYETTFNDKSCISLIGSDITKHASQKVYEEAGIGPESVDVIELHDCFSTNELITYEALGLCPVGKAGEFIDAEDNTYGGKYVVNPSGGLISKGHPLGATGLAQCSELCWQLRGTADKRQVPGAKIALQHNLGLGSAAVITMYALGFPEAAQQAQESAQERAQAAA